MISHLRAWLCRWLGVDVELAQLRADLDAHTAILQAMADQLNRTTIGFADATRRLRYYEEHVESIRYACKKLRAQQNGGNGESRIIRLGQDS